MRQQKQLINVPIKPSTLSLADESDEREAAEAITVNDNGEGLSISKVTLPFFNVKEGLQIEPKEFCFN